MPLSPEQEWTIVACGLVAHADGILEVGEWDQVLWMLDDRVAEGDTAGWLDVLADRDALLAKLDSVPLPPPFFAETILERAWRMTLADGRGSDEEAAVHDDVARRLGVDAREVQQWREKWLQQAGRRAETVAAFAARLAHADGVADSGERAEFADVVARLPVEESRRQVLAALIDAPPEMDEIVGRLAAHTPEERSIALVSLAPLVRSSSAGDRERGLFLELAERVAVSRGDAERMLER